MPHDDAGIDEIQMYGPFLSLKEAERGDKTAEVIVFDTSAWILIYSALAILFALAAEEPAPVSIRIMVGVFWPLLILLAVLTVKKTEDVE